MPCLDFLLSFLDLDSQQFLIKKAGVLQLHINLYFSGVWLGTRTFTKNMCSQEIGLRAYNLSSILGSNTQCNSGDVHDHIRRNRISTLIVRKTFTRAPIIMTKMAMTSI